MSITACSSSEDKSSVSLAKASGDALLSKVQSELEAIAPIVKRSTLDLWWVNEDGYSIINDSSPAVEAQFPGCVNDDSYYSMWTANAKKVVAAIDSVMVSEEFTFDNSSNSSKSLTYSTDFNGFAGNNSGSGVKGMMHFVRRRVIYRPLFFDGIFHFTLK
jgi:hypothetical protein